MPDTVNSQMTDAFTQMMLGLAMQTALAQQQQLATMNMVTNAVMVNALMGNKESADIAALMKQISESAAASSLEARNAIADLRAMIASFKPTPASSVPSQ